MKLPCNPSPVVRHAALSEPETGPIGVINETSSSARLNVGLASLALMQAVNQILTRQRLAETAG